MNTIWSGTYVKFSHSRMKRKVHYKLMYRRGTLNVASSLLRNCAPAICRTHQKETSSMPTVACRDTNLLSGITLSELDYQGGRPSEAVQIQIRTTSKPHDTRSEYLECDPSHSREFPLTWLGMARITYVFPEISFAFVSDQ